jgi:hypothetical protein
MNYEALNNLTIDELDRLISVAYAKKQQLSSSTLDSHEFQILYEEYANLHDRIMNETIDLNLKDFPVFVKVDDSFYDENSILMSFGVRFDMNLFHSLLKQNIKVSSNLDKFNNDLENLNNHCLEFSNKYGISRSVLIKKIIDKFNFQKDAENNDQY